MEYYKLMLEYLKTHSFLCLDLINRNKYIVQCILSFDTLDESKLIVEVLYKGNRRFSITFDRNLHGDKEYVLKSIFEIIEEQPFCLNNFCNMVINKSDEIINDLCFKCAFYKNYKKELESECSICLEKNNIYSIHLRCNHIFHKKCLFKATEPCCMSHSKTKCPLCRSDLHFNNCMIQLFDSIDCIDYIASNE